MAEREREAAARIAVAEERARIARELHDIVAHAVSVMVLQVGAVRHKLPASLAEDRDALGGVERPADSARRDAPPLGAMRHDGDRPRYWPPSRASTASTRSSTMSTVRPLLWVLHRGVHAPARLDLSAYRIVQEGLTNALKHAHATHADVAVRYRSDEVRVESAMTAGRFDERRPRPRTHRRRASASRSTAAR